jgi:2-oxoisovalerate dehydrogenase E2 component (dihydrolipoyl transacylase)
MTPVEMPKANENLTEATLERWLVKEGDLVAKDQPLCEIITDKAKFEFPSPGAGVVLKLCAPERALLPVGYVLCALGTPGEPIPDDIAARNEALLQAHRGMMTSVGAGGEASPGGTAIGTSTTLPAGGLRATPAARRLAKEHKVDLAAVAGALKVTGPITEKDVKTFLERQRT